LRAKTTNGFDPIPSQSATRTERRKRADFDEKGGPEPPFERRAANGRFFEAEAVVIAHTQAAAT
jgi:hypothetical protein